MADAFDKMSGNGRSSNLFRRVSRLSRKSFRSQLPTSTAPPPPSTPQVAPTPTPSTPSIRGKVKRKASLEGIVKQLTSLAVSISTDDMKNNHEEQTSQNTLAPKLLLKEDVRRECDSTSLPGRLSIVDNSKLKRTNLMKRRESQALLEGVRKLRGEKSQADSGNNSNENG